jgi:hypothetical protein
MESDIFASLVGTGSGGSCIARPDHGSLLSSAALDR